MTFEMKHWILSLKEKEVLIQLKEIKLSCEKCMKSCPKSFMKNFHEKLHENVAWKVD